MSIRKLAINTIIILIITLILIVLPEIILRILFPEKAFSLSYIYDNIPSYSNSKYVFHEDYGWILKPNFQYIHKRNNKNGGDTIIIDTNRNSFRGPELKDNPNKRIIVYGDSNIHARFSTLENTFVKKLEKYISSNNLIDIEVVNAGTEGFGPDQNLIRFKNEANLYHPNLVIFHIFADNDFGDIIKNRIFELDENGELISTGYKFTDDGFRRIRAIKKYILSHLLTLKAIKKLFRPLRKEIGWDEFSKKRMLLLQEISEKMYLMYKESQPRKKFLNLADTYDIDIALNPEQESSKIKIKLMEEVLKKANDFARTKNIEFLVLIQPSVADLTNNFEINYEHLQEHPNYQKNNLTNAVEKICVSHNIKYINLFELFKKNNPEQLYFRGGNFHWNDQGQDIAAKETAYYINKREMLNDK